MDIIVEDIFDGCNFDILIFQMDMIVGYQRYMGYRETQFVRA